MKNIKTIWKEIPHRIEMSGAFVVTNNIKAVNAHGHKSHFWATNYIQYSKEKKMHLTFDAADRMIWDLTHYIEIPNGN